MVPKGNGRDEIFHSKWNRYTRSIIGNTDDIFPDIEQNTEWEKEFGDDRPRSPIWR